MSQIQESVSIIIPAKNEENYIGECLKHLNQAITEYGGCVEVLLIDNGSKDSTKEIAKGFNCRVIEEPGVSIGTARNFGVREAKGEIIAFLDADCLVHPKWITYCLEGFEDIQVGAVGTRAIPDSSKATWVEKCLYKLIIGAERPRYVNWIGTSNLFIRKNLFIEVGGFDTSLQTCEDSDIGYKITRKKKIILEKRIDTIHQRESKTLSQLFKRELWRGQDSLKSFKKNNYSLKELKSVLIPFINFISIISLPIYIFSGFKSSLIFSSLIFIFPLVFVMKKKVAISPFIEYMGCYIVALVYLAARSCSLIIRTDRL